MGMVGSGTDGVVFTCTDGYGREWAEEVRHASQNADSACPFLPSRQYKKGHAESAFRDACRTSSGEWGLHVQMGWGLHVQ